MLLFFFLADSTESGGHCIDDVLRTCGLSTHQRSEQRRATILRRNPRGQSCVSTATPRNRRTDLALSFFHCTVANRPRRRTHHVPLRQHRRLGRAQPDPRHPHLRGLRLGHLVHVCDVERARVPRGHGREEHGSGSGVVRRYGTCEFFFTGVALLSLRCSLRF